MSLWLARKVNQSFDIYINETDKVKVTVKRGTSPYVNLAIDAPKNILVLRSEVPKREEAKPKASKLDQLVAAFYKHF